MAKVINYTDDLIVHPTGIASDHAYASINSSYPITNGYTDATSTNYTRINLTTGSGATTYVYFTFDCSDIPANAIINSVTCQAKVSLSTTNSNRITTRQIRLYSGTTAMGSAYTVSTSTTAFTVTAGNWTRAQLEDARIRLYAVRGSQNTTSTYYFNFYGATLTIEYSVNSTEYTITADSLTPDIDVSPSVQDILSGGEGTIILEGASLTDIVVTDNNVDVTNQLVQHNVQSGSYSSTFIPSEFDYTNSRYDTSVGTNGVYSTNYIENGLTSHTSTTRCALYTITGSGQTSYMYYNFDCSDIPLNATITSVTCQFKGGSQGSSYYCSYVAQLCAGTTGKGSSVSVTGSNSSPSTVTINGGSNWTREELDEIKIKFQVTRGSSNTTTDSTWSFFGATLTVNYTITATNPYYWTYTINNIHADHAIVVDSTGVYIPPDEDPTLTYWPITISSINATTDPDSGTTRVVQGTNQVITISPTDPQLTLALDNGVDITSQLVGGTPSNTYTVTTQVSGADYGFILNSSTGYYVSTNDGVSKSASVARVNFDFEASCVVTFTYINYAEANYDYGLFGKLDTTVATDGLTASSGSSSPSDSTNNYQLAMCSNSSSTQPITYSIPAGQHFIDIKYGKDDASDDGNDSLQWKITEITATESSSDYTYTLNNIQDKHSLIFVFGNVSFYYITSTGPNGVKLFPDGQQVVLEGDSYKINIIPTNISDTITLMDNNIDVSSSMDKDQGLDKYGNPVVSYSYKLNNIQTNHTLTIYSIVGDTEHFYIKENGMWVEVRQAFRKVNGVWQQIAFSAVGDSNTNFVRKDV